MRKLYCVVGVGRRVSRVIGPFGTISEAEKFIDDEANDHLFRFDPEIVELEDPDMIGERK